jgi:hypothetical protein
VNRQAEIGLIRDAMTELEERIAAQGETPACTRALLEALGIEVAPHSIATRKESASALRSIEDVDRTLDGIVDFVETARSHLQVARRRMRE